MWRVVVGEEMVVGPYGNTLPPTTTRHMNDVPLYMAQDLFNEY